MNLGSTLIAIVMRVENALKHNKTQSLTLAVVLNLNCPVPLGASTGCNAHYTL